MPHQLPITDRLTSLLTSFLDVQSKRAEIASGNIANADTPGYVSRELKFDDYLKTAARDAVTPLALRDSNAASSQNLMNAPRIVEQTSTSISIDGNTVDTAREMSTLAETGVQFLTGTQLLQSRLRTLRAAIREGR